MGIINGFNYTKKAQLAVYAKRVAEQAYEDETGPALRRLALAMRGAGLNQISDDALTRTLEQMLSKSPSTTPQDIVEDLRKYCFMNYTPKQEGAAWGTWSFPAAVWPDITFSGWYWRHEITPEQINHDELADVFAMGRDYDMLMILLEHIDEERCPITSTHALLLERLASNLDTESTVLGFVDGTIPAFYWPPIKALSARLDQVLEGAKDLLKTHDSFKPYFPREGF